MCTLIWHISSHILLIFLELESIFLEIILKKKKKKFLEMDSIGQSSGATDISVT